jgi:hypothetical protein
MQKHVEWLRVTEVAEGDGLAADVNLEAVYGPGYRRYVSGRVRQCLGFANGHTLQVKAGIFAIKRECLLARGVVVDGNFNVCTFLVSSDGCAGKQNRPNQYQVFLENHI